MQADPPEREGLWSRLKRVRHLEWIAALLIGGIVLSLWVSSFEKKNNWVDVTSSSQQTSVLDAEAQLSEVLSSIEGAGKVRVMIHYVPGEARYGMTTDQGVPAGAIVVAEGADRVEVRLELTRAVKTLLGLPAEAVDVFTMRAEQMQSE